MKNIIKLLILGSVALLAGCQKALPQLELVSASTEFGPAASEGLITVSSTSAIQAASDKDWCTVTVDNFFVKVKVALNNEGGERTATVAITNQEGKALSVPVSQASVTFSGSFPANINVPTEGDTLSLAFSTNTTLKASVDPITNGVSVEVADSALIVKVLPNKGAARSSEISWYVDGARNTYKGIITVNQARLNKPVNAELIFRNYDYSQSKPEATTDHTLNYGVKAPDKDIKTFKYYILKKSEYSKDPDYYKENFIDFAEEFDEEDLASLNTQGGAGYVSWRFARGTDYVMLAYVENDVQDTVMTAEASTTALFEEPVEKREYALADISPARAKSDFYGTYNFYFTTPDYDSRVSYETTVTFTDGGTETDPESGQTYDLVRIDGITHTPWNDRVTFDQEECYWFYEDGYILNNCEDHGAFMLDGQIADGITHVIDRVGFENVIGGAAGAIQLGFTAEGNIAAVDSEYYTDKTIEIAGEPEPVRYGPYQSMYQWAYDEANKSIGYMTYLSKHFFMPQAAPSSAVKGSKKINRFHPASGNFGIEASKPMTSKKVSLKDCLVRSAATSVKLR